MASPQLEKGYVRIANELHERLFQASLGKSELALMLLLIRDSYGARCKTAALSTAQIAEDLDMGARNARLTLTHLIDRKFIVCIVAPSGILPGVYRVNKNWEEWQTDRKRPWPSLRVFCADQKLQESGSKTSGERIKNFRRADQKLQESDRESRTSIKPECPPKTRRQEDKKTPPNPQGETREAGECLETDELVDPQEAARANEPGSVDPTKLASLLTRFQVDHLKSLCLQDLQGVEPVLVPRARAKLETYLNTLPPVGWQESPQRWASYLRHWMQAGVKEVQEKRRDLMKMNDEYRKKHGVKFPADMAIQIAARLCGEMLAEKGVA